jgi:hypothetical protein
MQMPNEIIVERLKEALQLPDVELAAEVENLIAELEEETAETDRYWAQREAELLAAEAVAEDPFCYSEEGIPW